jgi:PAS domain S-box-containing protein
VSVDELPLRSLVEQIPVGIHVIQDERVVHSNAAYAEMIGYAPAEIVGKPVSTTLCVDGAKEAIDGIRSCLTGNGTVQYVAKVRHRDGRMLYLETQGCRVVHRGRPALFGVVVDVTGRVLTEQALDRSYKRSRRLAGALVDLREQQRRKLSRELHDTVGGMLTALKLRLSNLTRREADNAKIHEIDELVEITGQCIDTVRDIARNTRLATLDKFGFVPAVEEALLDFKAASSIDFKLYVKGELPRISRPVAAEAFRIFQEALTNVGRHSEATMIDVELDITETNWLVRIRDDGVGIPDGVTGENEETCGIAGMRERAAQIGAELRIARGLPHGTVIHLTIPIA